MRLVIDSNVWVSALVFGGNPRKVFEEVAQDGHSLLVSSEILSETRRILHAKFPDFTEDFESLVVALHHFIEPVFLGSKTVTVCRDSDDNKILETALLGKADLIVSGDKDLLTIGEFKDIKIESPAKTLKNL